MSEDKELLKARMSIQVNMGNSKTFDYHVFITEIESKEPHSRLLAIFKEMIHESKPLRKKLKNSTFLGSEIKNVQSIVNIKLFYKIKNKKHEKERKK